VLGVGGAPLGEHGAAEERGSRGEQRALAHLLERDEPRPQAALGRGGVAREQLDDRRVV
jgi:hypothetical protein